MVTTMPKKTTGRGKSTGRANYRYVGVRLDLYERLKALAVADMRSLNSLAMVAIRDYLDRHEPKATRKGGQ